MEPATSKPGSDDTPSRIPKIHLVPCETTQITMNDATYQVAFRDNQIRIARDPDNYTLITLKNQQVSYKSTILGGFALSEEMKGDMDYRKDFVLDWEDDMSCPELLFIRPPRRITRKYARGQSVELEIEPVSRYHVAYRDGVTADFNRGANNDFTFSFSTGFYGSFKRVPDESYTLNFKGDRLKPGEDDYRSISKFIFSRSKYTGNLLLIPQDDATVSLF